MKSTGNTADLYKAIIAVQAEMPVISKDSDNPYFSSKYASLPDIVKVIRPILEKHDLAVIQGGGPGTHEHCFTIQTRIIHKSGQYIEDELPMWVKDANPQKVGSAVTYARRYGLCAMLGIVADEDDDGNKASGNKQGPPLAGQDNATSDLEKLL